MPAREVAQGPSASVILEVAEGLRWTDPQLSAALAEHVARSADGDASVRGAAERSAVLALGQLDRAGDLIERALPHLRDAERAGRTDDAAGLRCEIAMAAVQCDDAEAADALLAPLASGAALPRRVRIDALTAWAAARAAKGEVAGVDAAAAQVGELLANGAVDRHRRLEIERIRATARRHDGDVAGALAVLDAAEGEAGDDGRSALLVVADRVDALIDLGRLSDARSAGESRLRGPADSTTSLALGRLRTALAGGVLLPEGDLTGAETLAREAETGLSANGHEREACRAAEVLASVAEQRGDVATAMSSLRRSHAHALAHRDTVTRARLALAAAVAAGPETARRADPARSSREPDGDPASAPADSALSALAGDAPASESSRRLTTAAEPPRGERSAPPAPAWEVPDGRLADAAEPHRTGIPAGSESRDVADGSTGTASSDGRDRSETVAWSTTADSGTPAARETSPAPDTAAAPDTTAVPETTAAPDTATGTSTGTSTPAGPDAADAPAIPPRRRRGRREGVEPSDLLAAALAAARGLEPPGPRVPEATDVSTMADAPAAASSTLEDERASGDVVPRDPVGDTDTGAEPAEERGGSTPSAMTSPAAGPLDDVAGSALSGRRGPRVEDGFDAFSTAPPAEPGRDTRERAEPEEPARPVGSGDPVARPGGTPQRPAAGADDEYARELALTLIDVLAEYEGGRAGGQREPEPRTQSVRAVDAGRAGPGSMGASGPRNGANPRNGSGPGGGAAPGPNGRDHRARPPGPAGGPPASAAAAELPALPGRPGGNGRPVPAAERPSEAAPRLADLLADAMEAYHHAGGDRRAGP